MSKTMKTSELSRTSMSRRMSKKKSWEVVGGQPVRANSNKANMLKLRQKMKKNGTLSATAPDPTTTDLAAACLASLDISYNVDSNPNKSLLDEEDSSNKIKNNKIVDVTGIDLLKRQKITASDRFGESSTDPWYQLDMEAPRYVRNITPQPDSKKVIDMTSVCAAIYSANETATKLVDISLPQLKNK